MSSLTAVAVNQMPRVRASSPRRASVCRSSRIRRGRPYPAEAEPAKFERAALRWLRRYLEHDGVTLLKAQFAVSALAELRGGDATQPQKCSPSSPPRARKGYLMWVVVARWHHSNQGFSAGAMPGVRKDLQAKPAFICC
jgi:hypothetical protein